MKNLGFTLVEVVVTVAIIGALVAVGLPMLRKYELKAKQNEAKEHLSMVYLIEKDTRSEFFIYAACLGDLGYSRERSSDDYNYAVGFGHPTASINFIGTASSVQARGGICRAITPSSTNIHWFDGKYGRKSFSEMLDVNSFQAAANASFPGQSQDIWTINENKELVNTQKGF